MIYQICDMMGIAWDREDFLVSYPEETSGHWFHLEVFGGAPNITL